MVSAFFNLPKIKPRKTALIGISVSLLAGGVLLSQIVGNHVLQKKEKEEQVVPKVKTVTALGRLEPEGDVIKIAASSSGQGGGQGNKIDKLLVKEGEEVKAGQVIAILDNSDKLKAAYDKAKEAVAIAQANLAKVQAGAKTGEIEAQKAEIARIKAQSLGEERAQREAVSRLEAQWEGDKATQKATLARLEAQLEGDRKAQAATIKRLEAQLNNAQVELRRYERLFKAGAIARSEYDSKRLSADTLVEQLNEAKAVLARTQATGIKQISEAKASLQRVTSTGNRQIQEARAVLSRIQNASTEQVNSAQGTLSKIAEVRPVDVTAAKAELRQAVASEKEARASFEQSLIKAPSKGVILKINSRSGETASNDGIVELGKVQQMMVVAEVYQAHISKIKEGQNVRVTSNSLGADLMGKVDSIGWQVQRQDVINSDPSENIDARVIEVKVRLNEESSKKAAKLTNLQVKAIFEL
ncbi:heterocyst specific ABC-transporter, membrane fusion protein DevB homolog [Calothrix parasitica NIES-267]|uniref:Heterocyst specific ABC-transporter, membrane fusion protein DevB homolog n=1 Tax=Calothrix parasitica NIES-267 TaxID=1973488 RepID=A0A1Z4M0K5_9CYAN|nr:heterocyst specific ABC-transporter, membrane fusion protein DevB homolog [Calothrix parasitica NIES-267]